MPFERFGLLLARVAREWFHGREGFETPQKQIVGLLQWMDQSGMYVCVSGPVGLWVCGFVGLWVWGFGGVCMWLCGCGWQCVESCSRPYVCM
jgi:hypothetical protein